MLNNKSIPSTSSSWCHFLLLFPFGLKIMFVAQLGNLPQLYSRVIKANNDALHKWMVKSHVSLPHACLMADEWTESLKLVTSGCTLLDSNDVSTSRLLHSSTSNHFSTRQETFKRRFPPFAESAHHKCNYECSSFASANLLIPRRNDRTFIFNSPIYIITLEKQKPFILPPASLTKPWGPRGRAEKRNWHLCSLTGRKSFHFFSGSSFICRFYNFHILNPPSSRLFTSVHLTRKAKRREGRARKRESDKHKSIQSELMTSRRVYFPPVFLLLRCFKCR